MSDLIDEPALKQADAQAVMAHLTSGVPLSPEVAARVRWRSEQRTEEVRQKCGTVEVAVDLIRAGRDEA